MENDALKIDALENGDVAIHVKPNPSAQFLHINLKVNATLYAAFSEAADRNSCSVEVFMKEALADAVYTTSKTRQAERDRMLDELDMPSARLAASLGLSIATVSRIPQIEHLKYVQGQAEAAVEKSEEVNG